MPIYVYFNGHTFSSVFEQFSFTSKFFGLKMQTVLLEKHQTIEILLMVDFLRISKMLHFSKFSRI